MFENFIILVNNIQDIDYEGCSHAKIETKTASYNFELEPRQPYTEYIDNTQLSETLKQKYKTET